MSDQDLVQADYFRILTRAYKVAFPATKPRIVVRCFDDGEFQLYLSDPDRLQVPAAQGSGKTLSEALNSLYANLKKKLYECNVVADDKKNAAVQDFLAAVKRHTDAITFLDGQ